MDGQLFVSLSHDPLTVQSSDKPLAPSRPNRANPVKQRGLDSWLISPQIGVIPHQTPCEDIDAETIQLFGQENTGRLFDRCQFGRLEWILYQAELRDVDIQLRTLWKFAPCANPSGNQYFRSSEN